MYKMEYTKELDISDFYFESIHKRIVLKLKSEKPTLVFFCSTNALTFKNFLEYLDGEEATDIIVKNLGEKVDIAILYIKKEYDMNRKDGYTIFIDGMEFISYDWNYTIICDKDKLFDIISDVGDRIISAKYNIPQSIIYNISNPLHIYIKRDTSNFEGISVMCNLKDAIILVYHTPQPSYIASRTFYELYQRFDGCKRYDSDSDSDDYYQSCACTMNTNARMCHKNCKIAHHLINKNSINQNMIRSKYNNITDEYILIVDDRGKIYNVCNIYEHYYDEE